MSESWSCFKYGMVGCLSLVVLAVAVPLILAVLVIRPLNRAIDTRSELEARHGPQDSYVPPLSGVPSADRIEAFLEVRQALATNCSDFQRAEDEVARLGAFDEQENVKKLEVIRQALSTTQAMVGMGPLIGDFYDTRNRELAAVDMGLGEYSYIYILVYGTMLAAPEEGPQLLGSDATNARVRAALRRMLANQLAALETVGEDLGETFDRLAAEVARLEADGDAVPWQHGVPPTISEALLPYRERLDAAYCGATMPLELLINEKRGLSIESR